MLLVRGLYKEGQTESEYGSEAADLSPRSGGGTGAKTKQPYGLVKELVIWIGLGLGSVVGGGLLRIMADGKAELGLMADDMPKLGLMADNVGREKNEWRRQEFLPQWYEVDGSSNLLRGEDNALVQARVMWMQELQKQTREESSWLGLTTFHSKETVDYLLRHNLIMHSNEDGHLGNVCGPISPVESSMHGMTADHECEKHTVNEMEFIDKSVIKEDLAPELEKEIIVSSSIEIIEDDTDEDDWLKEDSDLIGYSGTSVVVNEEDISFSDLEDDLDYTMPIKYKMALTEGDTMTKSSCNFSGT
ncbi:hypothetical protein OROHE_001061 [Orobanche hederae]